MATRKIIIFSLVIGVFAFCASALPAKKSYPPPPTKPGPEYYANRESQMIVRTDLCNTNVSSDTHFIDSGIAGENYRWRNGFDVHPDPAFTQEEYNTINNALYELSQHVCIRFGIYPQDSQPSGDYVFIKRGDDNSGCNAYVGRLGGRQEMNLQYNGCIYTGTIMHEAIHALGFFHEQSRPDRDDFVNIHWENIVPEFQFAFDKYDDSLTFSVPYDQHSIMHYNSKDFSVNGAETITAKNGQPLGSNGQLTGEDIQKLRNMYNC